MSQQKSREVDFVFEPGKSPPILEKSLSQEKTPLNRQKSRFSRFRKKSMLSHESSSWSAKTTMTVLTVHDSRRKARESLRSVRKRDHQIKKNGI